MDVVYASLQRSMLDHSGLPGETAEVLGILWAHTTPEDQLQHITARSENDRIDLLFYLAGRPTTGSADAQLKRVTSLLSRSHRASPALRRRFLPPAPLTSGYSAD